MASAFGAGAGADMLQEILRQKFAESLAGEQQKLAMQRLQQEDAYRRDSLASLQGARSDEATARKFAQDQATAKLAEQTAAQETAGHQAQLRSAIAASQNVAGTADPNGALGTRNALRVALTASGAKPTEIPQEPAPKPPKLYAVQVPGPNGQPVHKLVSEDEMKQGVPGYKAPAAMNNSGGGNGALTDDGVEYAATQFRVTGTMPPMGMGNAQARAAIINKAAAQAKTLGQTPAASIQKQAAYKSDGAALTKMRQMSAAAESYETKALAQADIVDQLSAKVPRTSIPLINQAIISGQTHITGDPATAQYVNAIQTFSTEYAKIMEGSTGSAAASSDAARKAAERLVNAAQNPRQLKATVDLMRKEMRLMIVGYDATIDHITSRMGGGAPSPAPAGGGAPASETPEQRIKRLLGGG